MLWLSLLLWTRAAPDPRIPMFLILYSIAAGAFCWWLPVTVDRLKISLPAVLAAAAGTGLLFALSENRSFSDEGQVLAIARFIQDEGVAAFFRQYGDFPWLGTRHPPLGPLMYGAVIGLPGAGLFTLRLLNVALGVALTALTFYLGRTLYDRATGLIAACLLISMPYFSRLSGVAMFDVALALLFTLAILLVASEPSHRLPRGAALGVVIGSGLLLKYEMVFVVPGCGGLAVGAPPLARVVRYVDRGDCRIGGSADGLARRRGAARRPGRAGATGSVLRVGRRKV